MRITYQEGQNLYEINAQDVNVKEGQSEFLNIVNKHGHGNDDTLVGMVSQVIKEYRKTTDAPTLQGWIDYHNMLDNIEGIEAGVKKNWAYFKKMKGAIDKIDIDTIRFYLKNLVYNKTFAGLQAQDMLLKDIAANLSKERQKEYRYQNGDADDERAQIDGYIIAPNGKKCGLQIKSESYRSHNTIEGTAPVQYVYYELKEDALYYQLDLNELTFKDEEEYIKIKNDAKKLHEEKVKEKEEKIKKQQEKEKLQSDRIIKKAKNALRTAIKAETAGDKGKAEQALIDAENAIKSSCFWKEAIAVQENADMAVEYAKVIQENAEKAKKEALKAKKDGSKAIKEAEKILNKTIQDLRKATIAELLQQEEEKKKKRKERIQTKKK